MPQDGLRSAVYRSFITCDDPKGVAECKTMRKSKTNSFSNDLNHSSSNKGKKIDFKTPKQETAEEVHIGAKNSNQVIDTYSNGGMRFDHHSKEIAKDLLKGALDLQESLMVLAKLQEASHYVSKFRKKSKEKAKDEKIEDQMRIRKSKSERYADYNHQTGFQKPRSSLDGSSRDCYDELRTVIRDSLARQNLLPPNFQEKTKVSQGFMLDSMLDIPSTSSTQSSTMNFLSFTSSDTSFSSDSTKRSKGPNLIAKLMGLEEIPSPQRFISSPKRFEIEKISNQRRPTFEIDMANVKKPQLSGYYDTEEKRLRDIVETMRYKGLLKGNIGEGSRDHLYHYNDNKKILIEDGPPIVIMKPMELEENDSQILVQKTRINDVNRGAVDFDEVCRKLREVSPIGKQGFGEFKEKEISKKFKVFGSIDQKGKNKKSEQMDKASKSKTKSVEMENLRSKVKIEKEPVSSKRNVSPQKSSPPMVISKNKPPLSRKGGDKKKNLKLAKELITEGNAEIKNEDEQIGPNCEDGPNKASTSTTSIVQLLVKEETDAPVDPIKDQLKNTRLETIAESEEETSYFNSNDVIPQTKETKFLLSNPLFLKRAQELFNIETNSQIRSSTNLQITDSTLILDVANELMLQKKSSTQLIHPPFFIPKTTKNPIFLTQLVDEVCKGLDDLSKYSENSNKKLITETLYSNLEKDMMGTGAWELGWRHGYCFDDIEQVVGEIENRVFDELIEGMFTDFSMLVF